MSYDWIGFLVLSLMALGFGQVLANREGSPFPARLVMAAVVVRILGSVARFEVIKRFYGAIHDPARYYHVGYRYAQRVWDGDLSVFTPGYWLSGGPAAVPGMTQSWWGTPFMEKFSGVFLTFLGPTMRGEFLVFSLLAFLGTYWMALAFARVSDRATTRRYATWIWLWPSLWFWPSAVGKEAVTIFAMGLVTVGYVGKKGRILWLPLAAGVGLAYALRPHVAVVLVLAAGIAHWLRSWRRMTPTRILELVVVVVVGIAVLQGMTEVFGIAEPDLEGMSEFAEKRLERTMTGGSAIEGAGGVVAIPMSFVTVWLRPFPWEVHNLMALFAALEMLALLFLMVKYRKGLWRTLRNFRRNRFLSFGLMVWLGYTLMIGLAFANLGLIARQRTPIYPYLFALLAATPALVGLQRRFRRRRRVGNDSASGRRSAAARTPVGDRRGPR